MNATVSSYLRALLTSWPLRTVGTDEEINGGDVVEWLGSFKQDLSALLRTQGDPEAAVIRSAIREVINTSFRCGEWGDDSEERWDDVYAASNAAEMYLSRLLGIPAENRAETVLSPLDRIRAALVHLKLARDLLREAGAPKATDKVRSALKSAQGAERHAQHAPYREARQNRKAGA
jgi:hypothetical protein